MNHSHSLGALT